MPEHSSFLTFFLAHIKDTLDHNSRRARHERDGAPGATWQSFEPIGAALLVAIIVLLVAIRVNSRLSRTDEALIPEQELTLRTFMEAFLGYFYDLAKSVMDAERAKRYFPLIGTSAIFVFFSNVMALIPGCPSRRAA